MLIFWTTTQFPCANLYRKCNPLVTHSFNDVCCAKYVRKMTIQANEIFLYTKLHSVIYYFNIVFPHPHFCSKSIYSGLLYLPMHFWHTISSKPPNIVIKYFIYMWESGLVKITHEMVNLQNIKTLCTTWKNPHELVTFNEFD